MSSKQVRNPARVTQRAPQSCITCAKRRVRCDKRIPCQECISRGIEDSCKRETVKVKGRIVENDVESTSQGGQPSYYQLLEENRRLRAQLTQSVIQLAHSDTRHGVVRNITESFEKDLFGTVMHPSRSSTILSESDIVWPNPIQASRAISFGKSWTSWIHCALHYPTFEVECHNFWQNGCHSSDNESVNSLWLSVYFSILSESALIFMNDTEAAECGIPPEDVRARVLHWYDAALFYLYKGDFLRNYNLLSVQAIAILGIVFNNVGDSYLYRSLWGSAIRIGQALRIDSDRDNADEDIQSREVRRRLWWTLMVCEWIPVPCRVSCISEADFEVALPAVLDDEVIDQDGAPQPTMISYHVAMIQVSVVYHRFRSALRLSGGALEDISLIVANADESLANIIEHLPQHLRGQDDLVDNDIQQKDSDLGWISWQRQNLCVVLLYFRIVINRVLQDQWIQDPVTFVRTRSICLSSAQGIINMAKGYTEPIARHRTWATSVQLFSAAIILAVEARFHLEDTQDEYLNDVNFCIDFLDEIKEQSSLAWRAVDILKMQIQGLEKGT